MTRAKSSNRGLGMKVFTEKSHKIIETYTTAQNIISQYTAVSISHYTAVSISQYTAVSISQYTAVSISQ